MSSATMARAASTALIALLSVSTPSLAAQTDDDIAPSEAEKRAFAAKDPAEERRWLQIAADGGRRDAQWLLGERYLRVEGSAQNLELGIELLRRAAAQGSARAQSLLGWAYSSGTGVNKDVAEAAKWFLAAARQEDGYALQRLAEFYYRGIAVTRDPQRGKRLLLRAAELGDRQALAGAWSLLLLGPPDDRNPRLGLHFLNKAAGAEDANAFYVLGREYLTGHDVPRDPVRAAEWFRRAADAKHSLGSLWLSELHAKGLGVPKDPARAEKMLQAALSTAKLSEKNLFSWALSVAPDEQLRNSALAIRVLEPALAAEKQKAPAYLDTLAAAYAEHGQFDKAVATQTNAIQTVRRTRPAEPLPAMEQRLELYRAGKAYREELL